MFLKNQKFSILGKFIFLKKFRKLSLNYKFKIFSKQKNDIHISMPESRNLKKKSRNFENKQQKKFDKFGFNSQFRFGENAVKNDELGSLLFGYQL